MKKRIFTLLLVFALLASLAPSAMAATVSLSTQNLSVNGVPVRCEKYNIDGSNYFKLRDLAYLLNGTGSQFAVGYDNASRTVTISCGEPYVPNGSELYFDGEDKSATAVLSSQTILIDGVPVSDLSVYNIGGSNYFKLRELGTIVGFDVDYNRTNNTAIVFSREAPATPTARELTAEQIYARCSPAVFYIEIYDERGVCTKTGSGFFITSGGVAVTNYHVISGAASASITLSDNGAVYKVAGVYDYNAEEDWAVLQIDGSGFQTLEIGDPDYNVGGATVYAIGSPLGLQNTISQGIISNPARVEGGITYIQISAAISSGSSGGALLNRFGQVIGITSATYTEGQNLNLSIPMTYLANMNLNSYTPLGTAHNGPSGTLALSSSQLNLTLGEPVTIIVTAKEQNCTDDVYVRYEISDESVVSCSWDGGWDGDDTPLTVTPKTIGNTEITIYFRVSGTDQTLDAKTISVTVRAAGSGHDGSYGTEFSVDSHELRVSLFGSGVINLHARSDMDYDRDNWASLGYYVDDVSILSCSWSEWTGDDVSLFITPLSAGSTDVTVVYYLVDGTVLAQETVHVTVIYAVLELSDYEINIPLGEPYAIDVSVFSGKDYSPLSGGSFNCYADDASIVSCSWSAQDGSSSKLYITPLKSGTTDVTVVYRMADGSVLAQDTLRVKVIYATMEFSVNELSLSVGESCTFTIKFSSDNPGYHTFFYEIHGDESAIRCSWGQWYDSFTTELTVTGLQPGTISLELQLRDQATDKILCSASIPVTVK